MIDTKSRDTTVVNSNSGSHVEYRIGAGGPNVDVAWLIEIGNALDRMIYKAFCSELGTKTASASSDEPLVITAHTGQYMRGYKMTYRPSGENLRLANSLSTDGYLNLIRNIDRFMVRNFAGASLTYENRMGGMLAL